MVCSFFIYIQEGDLWLQFAKKSGWFLPQRIKMVRKQAHFIPRLLIGVPVQATEKARKASAASFISFRTSFYEKTSGEFSKRDSSLKDFLAQALKALNAGRDAEGTADLTNNTDRTTRDLYVKSLSCRLQSFQR